MLTATQATSIKGTERYFETLNQGDYYVGVEVGATWNGKAASILGLEIGSPVTRDQFKALLSGVHPITGAKLAQRIRSDRRPGIDLTFSVPKSVSLAWAINKDERVIDALRQAVHETMAKDVEPLMCRRVRDGKNANSQNREVTANMVWADFLHKTARPVDGSVDCHLHIHAFVMNHSTVDGKHYAAEPEEIFRQRKSLQAKFEARLARTLETKLGYTITRSEFMQSGRLKAGWEIAGISRATCEKFSARTQQVEEYASEHGITDAAAKGKLAAKIRDRKDKGASLDKLRSQWLAKLTPEERAAFLALRPTQTYTSHIDEAARAEAAVRFALEHHLYRESAVERHVVVGTALEHGRTLTPEQIEHALDGEGILHTSRDTRGVKRDYVTTQHVLESETRMIKFARDSRGTRISIAQYDHIFKRDWLNDQQKAAVNHVLRSRDSVTAVTGGAGTGKSSLMEEAAEAIRANGKQIAVFAPSTGACEVLQEKGFADAKTVEHLIRNEKLHASLKDQVIWIDEAGLLDVRSMNAVFEIAKQQNARVVLSGDTRQHSSPRRGEALRILEQYAGLDIAKVDEIQRQKGKYKKAIELISLGHQIVDEKRGTTGLLAGFDLLDQLGKIKEIAGEERHAVLSQRYLQSTKENASALVVAPTHDEGKQVTQHIRSELRKKGAIGEEDREFSQLRSLNLSEAEKAEPLRYVRDGLILQFHQNVPGFKRGDRYRITQHRDGSHKLQTLDGYELGKNVPTSIPVQFADRFEVYSEHRMHCASGDKVRFCLGGTATDGQRRISNGRLDEVEGFDRDGNIRLKSGMTVSKDYGHWDLGYAITSHASQGKDRDIAIAAMGTQSLPAVNVKQFYVTVSRGRKEVAIYVDDKAAIRRAIQSAGEQRSATELFRAEASDQQQQKRMQLNRHNQFLSRVRQWWQSHMSRQSPAYAVVRTNNSNHPSPSKHLERN